MPKNPHADFTPTLAGYSGITPFRFWCQTALPLTYDDSLSYYELLNKVVNYLNHTIEDLTNVENNTSELAEAYDKLQKYVNDYFDDIDIEAELRNVLDGMAEDGTLDALLDPLVANRLPDVVGEQISDVVAEQIDDAVEGQIDDVVGEQLPPLVDANIGNEVSDWLNENVDPVGSAVLVDNTLTISGAAADAQKTGNIKANVNDLCGGFKGIVGCTPIMFSDPRLRQYILTNGATGTAVDWDNPRTSTTTNIKWAVIECTPGQHFTITGQGGSGDRLWTFTDVNKNILEPRASAGIVRTKAVITAPADAKYLIVNDESDSTSYIGILFEPIELIEDNMGVICSDTIHVNAGSSHSSANDQIPVDIPAGSEIAIVASRSSSDTNTIEVRGYDENNTSVVLLSSNKPNETKVMTTSVALKKIGLTVGTGIVIGGDYSYLIGKNYSLWYKTKTNTNEITEIKEDAKITINPNAFQKQHADIRATNPNTWGYGNVTISAMIPIDGIKSLTLTAGSQNAIYAFLTDNEINIGQAAHIVGGGSRNVLNANSSETKAVPDTAKYLYVLLNDSSGNNTAPSITAVVTDKYLANYTEYATTDAYELAQCYKNVLKKADQLKNIPWTALSDVPSNVTNTPFATGNHNGIPYSSVKEYDKFVGFEVSLRTFMTATKNPFSLLYTENVNKDSSPNHEGISGYGITYHGKNCASYYGAVCNTLVGYSLEWDIPWNTGEFDYLCRMGAFSEKADQTAKGINVGDIIWEDGHGNIITDVLRDNYGDPVLIAWTETQNYLPKTTWMLPATFNTRVKTPNSQSHKIPVVYEYNNIYKNSVYSRSEFIAVGNEPTPSAYVYNDDICTFAGDYAAFHTGEEVWINYNLGSTVYDTLILKKDGTVVNTISLVTTEHKVSLGTNLDPGLYTAELSLNGTTSNPTYFEVVDTTVSATRNGTMATINFSSENGAPLYVQFTELDGSSLGIYPLTDSDKNAGQVVIDYADLYNKIYKKTLNATVYLKVFFRGRYGVVRNELIQVS